MPLALSALDHKVRLIRVVEHTEGDVVSDGGLKLGTGDSLPYVLEKMFVQLQHCCVTLRVGCGGHAAIFCAELGEDAEAIVSKEVKPKIKFECTGAAAAIGEGAEGTCLVGKERCI